MHHDSNTFSLVIHPGYKKISVERRSKPLQNFNLIEISYWKLTWRAVAHVFVKILWFEVGMEKVVWDGNQATSHPNSNYDQFGGLPTGVDVSQGMQD